eukprot:10058484-Ditylum_brightwellii.AAC.1
MEECRITINHRKGCTHHEREYRFQDNKNVCFSGGRAKSCKALPDVNKDLHMIINEKIAMALDHKEKKERNKFEALSILSNSNKDEDRDSNSR